MIAAVEAPAELYLHDTATRRRSLAAPTASRPRLPDDRRPVPQRSSVSPATTNCARASTSAPHGEPRRPAKNSPWRCDREQIPEAHRPRRGLFRRRRLRQRRTARRHPAPLPGRHRRSPTVPRSLRSAPAAGTTRGYPRGRRGAGPERADATLHRRAEVEGVELGTSRGNSEARPKTSQEYGDARRARRGVRTRPPRPGQHR